MSVQDFEAMTAKIAKQSAIISELKSANDFLNSQIREYNKEFSNEVDTNKT